ncbi:hypothetical protein [Streptomyces sp. SID12488]|uniref:hypothetical protein n=1 Tax=Streptomyces sp. SID12488 TaxID=2706040 RepID=UPI0013DA1B07|nr:hypothetical protein [Streptomyces sp. SID12488]NEA62915.1 hypothetical protein [Streptomyces sp. SID12488]
MGTAERREALGNGVVVAAPLVVHGGARSNGTGQDMGGGSIEPPSGSVYALTSPQQLPTPVREKAQPAYEQLWVEEPARRRRLPDPVRTAAVRAVLVISVTLIQAMVAFLSTLAGSWLAFPMVISSVASTVLATWAALDVWVTRQVWRQRNGVVSTPSSTARALRRERRKARRLARTTARTQERIRRQGGGSGQLSHP